MRPEHLGSTDPSIFDTTITDTGALAVSSGLRTGRSPKDKRIVEDEITKNVIIFSASNFNYRLFGGVVSTSLSLLKGMPGTGNE